MTSVEPRPWLAPVPVVNEHARAYLRSVTACLFDLDGVLTDSGRPARPGVAERYSTACSCASPSEHHWHFIPLRSRHRLPQVHRRPAEARRHPRVPREPRDSPPGGALRRPGRRRDRLRHREAQGGVGRAWTEQPRPDGNGRGAPLSRGRRPRRPWTRSCVRELAFVVDARACASLDARRRGHRRARRSARKHYARGRRRTCCSPPVTAWASTSSTQSRSRTADWASPPGEPQG